MQVLVRVPTTFGATGHVVQIVNTLDRKRDMPITLDKRQIAPRVPYLRQQYHLAIVDTEFSIHDSLICDHSHLWRVWRRRSDDPNASRHARNPALSQARVEVTAICPL